MPQIKTVKLYGELGTKFGREYKFAVKSPAEAVAALASQLPGFEAHMTQSKDRGVAYAVFLDKENIGEEDLLLPSGGATIRIAPVIMGSKRAGWFQIILGVAMIALAVFTGGLTWAAYTAGTAGMWGAVATFGMSMILGGVVQLLSPQPKGIGAKDRPEDQGSAIFNGPVNTQAQGNPVPYLFGELIVGSAVVSAGIMAEDGVIGTTDNGTQNPDGTANGGAGGGAWWRYVFYQDEN